MAANWIKTRQTKYGAYVTVYILVILAVLTAVNFLANRYDQQYDSTKNKQFSLSDQTRKVVKGLKGDIHITYFDRTEQFPTARNLLSQYSDLSPKVHVEYIDPVKKPQQARAAGFTRDSNILVDSGTRKEPAKSLSEEEVTGALIRSLKTGERNVCFLSLGGEHGLNEAGASGFSTLKQLLERDNYKTRTITPKAEATEPGKPVTIGQAPVAAANADIPKDCTVLVVGGPQVAYPPAEVDVIKKYMNGGGRALFMFDEPLKIGRESGPSDSPELLQLLASWGVTVNKDLVLDLSGIGQIFGLGPEVPLITQYESHNITRPLQGVPSAFPVARSLGVQATTANTTVEKLVATTDNSVAVTEIGPNGAIDVKKGTKGPLTIAAAGTITNGNVKSRFIVTGTSQWATNNLAGSGRLGNRDLFSNMVNWLSSDEDLISIRPKEPENQTLNMTGQKQTLMFWLSIVFFPLAVVAMGLGTWWKRR